MMWLRLVLRWSARLVTANHIQSFLALMLGFSFAGLCASAYQLVMQQPASFRLLGQGPKPATFAAIPLLTFAAPFIIMRNTIRARRVITRRFEVVMIATIVAGFWSLVTGSFVVMTLRTVGILQV
jgi:hypothetical protein